MGRRRTHDHDLPPHMHRKVRGGSVRYYYGRQSIALGSDFPAALRKYAELHALTPTPGTFAEAVTLYRREELHKKAPRTRAGYDAQLSLLLATFGHMPLDSIQPADVSDLLVALGEKRTHADGRVRGGPIIATRTKALLSAVINLARARRLMHGPNPCAGIRGTKSHRDRMVSDAELAHALRMADPELAGFLELVYRSGQRPGDVVQMRRTDVQDGALCVRQDKTGARVRVEIVGPLKTLIARLTSGAVASVFLIHNARGQPFTLAALRKRFDRLGLDWQIRDLRAKAASDSDNARDAQSLLGHKAASTTDGYIRQRAGTKAKPIMRKIADKQ